MKQKNHTQSKSTQYKSKAVRTTTNVLAASRQVVNSTPSRSSEQAITEKHNFAHDITITLENNNNNKESEISKTEQHVVDNIEQTALHEHTRVITLNNKYAPSDVMLAVAVKKDKYLSKTH